jgi:hypothetical protein
VSSWFLALLFVAEPLLPSLVPAQPVKPGGCPADARLDVNLPAWKAALNQADTPRRREDVLAEVKLALALPEPETPEARPPRVSLLGIDDTAVQLGPGRPDHVIQVRYAVETPDDKATIYLVQVLRPLEERRWCALGAELSRRDDPARKLETFTLGFVPLLEARGKAIEVQRGESQLRRSDTFREYWVAHGFKLRKVFDERIGSMQSGEAGGATTTKIGKLTLAGGFPKRIDVREVTKHGGCEAGAGDTPCDDSEPSSTFTFVYDGTKYVRAKHEPAKHEPAK